MNLEINAYHVGDRPVVVRPNVEFYNLIGENGVREMVSKHYDLLRKSELKSMFPTDDTAFKESKRNSADFFIQILGGPEYYNLRRGKPMLVARHNPFTITLEGRIIWLKCYRQVLLEMEVPEYLIESFWNYLNVFSSWMTNTDSKI